MKKDKKNELAVATAVKAGDPPVELNAKTNNKSGNVSENKGMMTIYEYEEKYVKRQNARGAKFVLNMLVALIGVFFVWCFFSICKSVWDINNYAGYAAIAVCVLLFIFLYIVPVVKIFRLPYFITNVNYKTAAKAKRQNKKSRRQIAERIVDVCESVAGVGWYDSANVEKLENGIKNLDDEAIKEGLTALYAGSVKKSAKDIIFRCSVKCGMYSALSQDEKIDAMLIAVVNLQMIKDLVFLYGFRPSDARLLKIFAAVVRNSLVAYGLGGIKIGNGVVRTLGDAAKGIPLLGSVISTLVDSSVQGLTNGMLTAIIGFQTIRYLNTEYRLQNILDGVNVSETEEELTETCAEVEKELKAHRRSPQNA